MTKRNSGFTLVELAIVLVIIGLILLAVLTGQDLIQTAKIRATIAQYNQFVVGVNNFKIKYSYLPGDVRGNEKFGFTGDGNEDGFIDDNSSSSENFTNELQNFWLHLSESEMLPGSYDPSLDCASTNCTPRNAFPLAKIADTGWVAFSDINDDKEYLYLGAYGTDTSASGRVLTKNILSPLDAQRMDEKIDDGKPFSGIVFAKSGGNGLYGEVTHSPTALDSCIKDNDNTLDINDRYNTLTENLECTLRFDLQNL